MYYSDSKAIKILILHWVKKNSVFISCKQLEDSPQKNPVHHFLDFKTVYMEYQMYQEQKVQKYSGSMLEEIFLCYD